MVAITAEQCDQGSANCCCHTYVITALLVCGSTVANRGIWQGSFRELRAQHYINLPTCIILQLLQLCAVLLLAAVCSTAFPVFCVCTLARQWHGFMVDRPAAMNPSQAPRRLIRLAWISQLW